MVEQLGRQYLGEQAENMGQENVLDDVDQEEEKSDVLPECADEYLF